MHNTRRYHVTQTLLIIVVGFMCFCLYKVEKTGLADPKQAQFWFVLLLASVLIGSVVGVAYYYFRTQSTRSNKDTVAMEALMVAGQQLAKQQKQLPPTTPATTKPTPR